jgi:mannitol/fructose-specific phosphotransferase system IIA component
MDKVVEFLTQAAVRLGAQAASKEEAIRQSGDLLVEAGYVAPAYRDGMLAREKVLSTCLGSGIAIPHGRSEDLGMVYHTGASVLQLPGGVDWGDGENVYLVIGLAAILDESDNILHNQRERAWRVLLNNLMELLHDPQAAGRLAHTDDPLVIVDWFTRGLAGA